MTNEDLEFQKRIEQLDEKDCPLINRRDTLSEQEKMWQQEWINNNPEKVKAQLIISGGKL